MKVDVGSAVGVVLVIGCAAAASTPAIAGISGAGLFAQYSYQQTGPSTVTATNGGANSSLNAFVGSASPSDFDSASMTYPGAGSPQGLPLQFAGLFGFTSPSMSESALNAAYPSGVYTFGAANSVTSASQSVSLSYNIFSFSAIPQLAASTFSALRSWNPKNPFTLNFNSYTPDPNSQASDISIQIFGPGGFYLNTLSPSATSALVPANWFSSSGRYTLYLTFDQSASSTDPNSGAILSTAATRGTFLSFSMAPEPGAWAMLLLGFGGLGAITRRRRQAIAAA